MSEPAIQIAPGEPQAAEQLVVQGKDPAPNFNFYDTAFVVGPNGNMLFRPVKSVRLE